MRKLRLILLSSLFAAAVTLTLNAQYSENQLPPTPVLYVVGQASAPATVTGLASIYYDNTIGALRGSLSTVGFFTIPQTGNTGTGTNKTGFHVSVKNIAGCTTAASIGGICASAITVTWPTSLGDVLYSAGCNPSSAPTNLPSAPYIVSKVAGGATMTVNYYAVSAAAASWATIDCWATHD